MTRFDVYSLMNNLVFESQIDFGGGSVFLFSHDSVFIQMNFD